MSLSTATLDHIRASVAAAPPLHAETLERLARLLPPAVPVRANTATKPRELAGAVSV
jgi:hypothetical protein